MKTNTKKESVKQIFRANIFKNKYKPGERLASSAELAKQLGVSEGTVHLALSDLHREKIVRRIHGSGTYVNDSKETITINVPVVDPEKILEKHFWGKIREMADSAPQRIKLKRTLYKPSNLDFNQQRLVVKLFTMPQPVGLFKITMNDLHWLAHAGFCEDLTSLYSTWSQKDNIYQIAADAVTYNGNIYGLPFCAILTGMVYQKDIFEHYDIAPEQALNTIDGFIRTIEMFSRSDKFQYSFWTGSTRIFLMYLLRAYCDNLTNLFLKHKEKPIEREIGIEILRIVKHLKWKLKAFMPTSVENSNLQWNQLVKSFSKGMIPMGVSHLVPQNWYREKSGRKYTEISIVPMSFSKDKKSVSFFNCDVWFINPFQDSGARDFLRFFLSEYIHPYSQYELDRKHLEENSLNARCTVFKRVPKRIPADSMFEEKRKELFDCAEPMLPFPLPAFDKFVVSVYRVILDPDATPEKEYDFYKQTFNGIGFML